MSSLDDLFKVEIPFSLDCFHTMGGAKEDRRLANYQ
jgi:hypothetical protein